MWRQEFSFVFDNSRWFGEILQLFHLSSSTFKLVVHEKYPAFSCLKNTSDACANYHSLSLHVEHIGSAPRGLWWWMVAKVTDRCHQRTSPLQRKSSRAEYDESIFSPCPIEVKGIQGAGPQIGFCGAVSPKSPDHGDNPLPPPRPSTPSPLLPLINIRCIFDDITTCYFILYLILVLHLLHHLPQMDDDLHACPKELAEAAFLHRGRPDDVGRPVLDVPGRMKK